MNIPQQLDELIKKVDMLQKQLNQQNEFIMDQSLIIQKLIEKIRPIQHYPRHTEEDFKKDNWQPYKGPDCTTVEHIRDENSFVGGKRVCNVHKSYNYDGTVIHQFPGSTYHTDLNWKPSETGSFTEHLNNKE